MALELKKRSKIFLKNQRVSVEESTSTPDSFGITNLPDFFGEGKNTFKLKPGTGYLKSGTQIQIEILDVNGNPIYWETSTYKDSDNSRLVSIWIYDLPNNKRYDTPNGKAELIVVGTLKSGGNVRWTRKINVIKSRQSTSDIVFNNTPSFTISSSVDTFTNKSVSGSSLINTETSHTTTYERSRFGDSVSIEQYPITTFYSASFQTAGNGIGDDIFNYFNFQSNAPNIEWFTSSIFDGLYVYETSDNDIFAFSGSTTFDSPYAKVDEIDSQGQDIFLQTGWSFNALGALSLRTLRFISDTSSLNNVFEETLPLSNPFNQEMVGGTLRGSNIPTLYPILRGGQSQPTNFTASITEVLSDTVLRINSPITSSDNRSDGSIHTYDYTDDTFDVEISYYSTGSDTSTQNQIAFANISLTNVNPIGGRVYLLRTSIKSDGLSNSDYSVIGETLVENTSSISYKVPIPTEQLNDPKTLRIQFVNEVGSVSTTELVRSGLVFRGGNVYIAGDQSLITGSFHIGNTIGSGIEMAGHSSGYLKSVGYNGFTSASLGKGPGGFLIWSGSGNLSFGEDQYPGVGMEMVSQGGSSSFYFTTHDGGQLKVITDEFFIGTEDTQFISGSNGNIEISSSFFHLNPKDNEARIGGFVVTETAISSSQNITGLGTPLALKSNGEITGSSVIIRERINSTNYTIFDTKQGIVDARNVGRQVVSDSNEYIRANVDDGSSYVTIVKYPVTILPNETKIGISLMGQTISNSSGNVASNVRLQIAIADTGSNPSGGPTYYDSYSSVSNLHIISIPALGTSVTGSRTFGPDDTNYIQDIPSSYQGAFCELRLQISHNPITSLNTSTRIKNISIITTREVGGDFASVKDTFDPDPPILTP